MTHTHLLLLGFPDLSEEAYWEVVHALERNPQHPWPPRQMLWLAAYRDQEGWLRVAEGYSDPTAINFEVLGQALQACGVAGPKERALFPVTALAPLDAPAVASVPLHQIVVLEARYSQAGRDAYQRVMAHPAIEQFAPHVIVHAGGADEQGTVQVLNLFPSQEAANQAFAVLGPVFAELHSPAADRQLTGTLIDFRWLAADRP
ncbi:MAG TPA: hypothetical protein VKT82_16400 [Ktedonobacterales bacterium]|nr:hypothetical protein [Ktedonobacterales bacterium]